MGWHIRTGSIQGFDFNLIVPLGNSLLYVSKSVESGKAFSRINATCLMCIYNKSKRYTMYYSFAQEGVTLDFCLLFLFVFQKRCGHSLCSLSKLIKILSVTFAGDFGNHTHIVWIPASWSICVDQNLSFDKIIKSLIEPVT